MNRRRLGTWLPLCAGMLVAVGCTGPMGQTGATGAQGQPGMTGSQGPSGMTGAQGTPGMTGAQGSAGAPGVQGSPGLTGVQGPAGVTGAQGVAAPGPGAPVGTVRWTSLGDILFDYDRAEIRYSESRKPAEIAAYMSQNPSVRLGIDGYTDSRGTPQHNLPMSQRRVTTVRDALIQAGVPAERIEMGTFGTDRQVCNPATEQCSLRDGRVEVLVRTGN